MHFGDPQLGDGPFPFKTKKRKLKAWPNFPKGSNVQQVICIDRDLRMSTGKSIFGWPLFKGPQQSQMRRWGSGTKQLTQKGNPNSDPYLGNSKSNVSSLCFIFVYVPVSWFVYFFLLKCLSARFVDCLCDGLEVAHFSRICALFG